MPPFQRLTRDLHNQLRISAQLETVFRTALGQLPRRAFDSETFKGPATPKPDQVVSRLTFNALTEFLPGYVASVTLHNIASIIDAPAPASPPRVAMHDDMPVALAVRMMKKSGADIALVATADGPRYVSLDTLQGLQNGLKSAFRSEAGHTLTEIFSLGIPVTKYPARGFDRLYDAAAASLCHLQTWYQCQADGTCIMNRSDCPRDQSHATLMVDASECCL